MEFMWYRLDVWVYSAIAFFVVRLAAHVLSGLKSRIRLVVGRIENCDSKIISNPVVSTNAYVLYLAGDGIAITLQISSFAPGFFIGSRKKP